MKHEQISELLPWYVSGTLSKAELHDVKTHLPDCGECRREVEQLRLLQKAEIDLSGETPELPQDLLAQALDQIEEYERERGGAREERAGAWERLVTAWAGLWTPTPVLVRAMVAVQFLLLVGVTAFYLAGIGGDEMGTAGGPGGATVGAQITVRFDASASEETIRGTLRQVEARIVDGPSALGLYVVQLPATLIEDAEINRVIEALRARTGIIAFAERKP